MPDLGLPNKPCRKVLTCCVQSAKVTEDLAKVGRDAEAVTSASSIYLQHPPVDLGVARVSTSGHVPCHPLNARALRRGVAELGDPAVDRLRHPAELVGIAFAFLAEASVREPPVKGLRLHQLLVSATHEGVEVVARVHLAELPQHLRLVAPLERHHGSLYWYLPVAVRTDLGRGMVDRSCSTSSTSHFGLLAISQPMCRRTKMAAPSTSPRNSSSVRILE